MIAHIHNQSLDDVVNWLRRNGITLQDIDTLVSNPGEWIPIREGRVRLDQDFGRYSATIE
jgi:hypothetical protein